MTEKENSWVALAALGLAGLGMVLFYLLARRALFGARAPELEPPEENTWFSHLPPAPALAKPAKPQLLLASAQSQTVPLISSDATCVVTAWDDRAAEVVVRAITPAGEFAIVSVDYLKAATASLTNPVGGVFVVPVGGAPQKIRLRPGQGLYAKGSQDDVLFSATMSEVRR